MTAQDGTVASVNVVPLATPEHMLLQRAALRVRAVRVRFGADDGPVEAAVVVEGIAVAMFVTLTTLAHGRFERNAFLFRPPSVTVRF